MIDPTKKKARLNKMNTKHKVTYVPFGETGVREFPTNSKTEVKKVALDAIKNGHSNVTVHTFSPSTNQYYADADFNREIADAHMKRISTRDIAPLISLRKLADVSSRLAKVQAKKDLSLEEKNELSAILAEVTMNLHLIGTEENVTEVKEIEPPIETPQTEEQTENISLAPLTLNPESVANWQDETPIGAVDLPDTTNTASTPNETEETNQQRTSRFLGRRR